MSGLFAALYNNTNAMRAHTSALEVTSRNMANVNNPAYARQRIIYGDKGTVNTPLGALSLGIEAVGIQQMRDRLLDRQITEETSISESFKTQISYLQQAQTALGQGLFGKTGGVDTIAGNAELPAGIAASLDQFFNAWQAFASNPTTNVVKQQLIAATDDLVGKIQLADRRLGDIALPSVVGNTLTGQMDAATTTVNGLLASIADLNRQIGRVEVVTPGSGIDLRDQRQAKLEELSKYLDFTTVDQTAGQVAIQVVDSSSATVNLVDLSVVQGSLARNGTNYDWTPLTGPAVTLDVNSGKLAGFQDVGATIQGYRTDLDSFVSALVTQVNTAYNSATNGDFFTATGTTAATFQRNATVSTVVATDIGGAAGGNDRALAVAQLATNKAFLSGTPAEAFGSIVVDVAQDVSTTVSRIEDQDTLSQLLKAQRDSYGGVSLDEEAADMMRLQRAFQASAKMLGVMDEMLNRIIETLAR